jgi:hypothetical protein
MNEKLSVQSTAYCRADALVAEANRMMMVCEDRYEMWALDHPHKAEAIWLRYVENRTIGFSTALLIYLRKIEILGIEAELEVAAFLAQ